MTGERPNVKIAIMNAVGASGLMGASFLFGALALEHDQHSLKAETVADALEAQGNPDADVWEDRADAEEEERNRLILVAGALLVSSACAGAASKLQMMPKNT